MFQFHCWNNSFRTFFYLKSNCLPEYGPRFFWCRSATDGARPGWDMGSATGSLGPPPPPWWEGDSLELLLNPPTCLCCWSTAIILASWDDITKNKNNHWRGGSKKQKQNKTKQEERSVCVCVCIPAEGQSADVCLVWTSSGFAVAAAAAAVVAAAAAVGGGADKPEWTLKKMQKDVRSQHKEKRIKSNIFGSSLYKPEKKREKVCFKTSFRSHFVLHPSHCKSIWMDFTVSVL